MALCRGHPSFAAKVQANLAGNCANSRATSAGLRATALAHAEVSWATNTRQPRKLPGIGVAAPAVLAIGGISGLVCSGDLRLG